MINYENHLKGLMVTNFHNPFTSLEPFFFSFLKKIPCMSLELQSCYAGTFSNKYHWYNFNFQNEQNNKNPNRTQRISTQVYVLIVN